MTGRFRCSDPLAGDFEFSDVQEVLDALEAALVAPDTPMLDTARQSWQAVAAHPEVRAAWIERARMQSPVRTGLVLPDLPAVTAVSAGAADEAARRRAAFARVVQGLPAVEDLPEAEGPPPAWSPAALLALIGAALLLGLIGWGLVGLAARVGGLAD